MRPLLLLLFAVSAATTAGCQSIALKELRFPVSEDGRSVVQHRFFMDGLSRDDPKSRAFERAQRGDPKGAIALLGVELARHPGDTWMRYDRGILYEATGAWDEAEAELREARRGNVHEQRFVEELAFIRAHK